MTITGWFGFVGLAIAFIGVGGVIAVSVENIPGKIVTSILTTITVIILFVGMRWYYSSTASGQRAMTDQKSDLGGGIERVVTVYTANGDVIAKYEGKIDFEKNDGGYIKFDFEGKRYIYYNCFVESIADIED